MHKISTSSALIAVVTIATAHAKPAETIVVTATRTAQALARTGDSLSVITAQDLQAQQILTVDQGLAQTPGLAVVRNGGLGQTTTIGLRGAEAGQTLVLIDGVRINDPSTVDGASPAGRSTGQQYRADRSAARAAKHALWQRCDRRRRQHPDPARGRAPLCLTASAEGGSFDTYRLNAAANGAL